jgi:hypothetical protein
MAAAWVCHTDSGSAASVAEAATPAQASPILVAILQGCRIRCQAVERKDAVQAVGEAGQW